MNTRLRINSPRSGSVALRQSNPTTKRGYNFFSRGPTFTCHNIFFFDNISTTKINSWEKVFSSNLDARGNSKHFLLPVNGGKKLNLELSLETQSHMRYFFCANLHLISLFYRVIIRKILYTCWFITVSNFSKVKLS